MNEVEEAAHESEKIHSIQLVLISEKLKQTKDELFSDR